ncbi:helix-turn-helix domain-containing protein [Streptomyces sp. NPDC006544]|uniref:helix-turn-helix domain-containing protein n=1 Tax=Streptomyces sp. NPDC006544 TaxID=3154583 RepID=UPI0033A60FAF
MAAVGANQSTGGQVTPEELDTLRRLHAEGKGRNEIARLMDRGQRTISIYAERLGLSFDRTATAVATEARVIDSRARRLDLVDRYHAQIGKLLDRLDRPSHRIREVSFGKVVTYEAEDLPSQDVRNLMQAVATATTQAAKLEALDSDNGVGDAKSMLGQLAAGLTAAYQAMDEGAGDAP